mgnify:CR=1 FL=1
MNIYKCPYCDYTKLYDLKNNYKKCASCKTKFSTNKVQTDIFCIEYFSNNINANKTSQILDLNYRTVQNRYTLFRKLIASFLDEEYNNSIKDNSSYEEYYYFPTTIQNKKKRSLFDATNIIGFYSNKKIYTLLMPKLPKYSSQTNTKDYEYYLKWHKLYSKNSYQTPLSIFWKYLEENLKKYKGVDEKNFFYYLKECEFKFNYLHNMQIEILKNLYFNKKGISR